MMDIDINKWDETINKPKRLGIAFAPLENKRNYLIILIRNTSSSQAVYKLPQTLQFDF